MSREIKFRAWVKSLKKYCPVQSIDFDWEGNLEEVWVWVEENVQEPFYAKEVILEQDTGLKDKNGERIREGDIIREKWYDNDVNRGRDRIGKIEYFCDRYVCWFGGTFVDLGMFPSENIEVIGNIHENEELLK